MAKSTPAPAVAARERAHDGDPLERLRQQTQERLRPFREGPVIPPAAYDLEKGPRKVFDEAARALLEQEFNRLEPADKHQAAAKVRYHGPTYRINKKTPAEGATSFGPLTLRSLLYLAAEDGEPGLHPLHVRLGVQGGGATAVLAERGARVAVEHSQREVRQWLPCEHGLGWSNDRLRRVLREFRRTAVAFREEAQQQRRLHWLGEAERSRGRHRPVLALGRDGVMVPLRGQGYQEASAATASVSDRGGRRLGTG